MLQSWERGQKLVISSWSMKMKIRVVDLRWSSPSTGCGSTHRCFLFVCCWPLLGIAVDSSLGTVRPLPSHSPHSSSRRPLAARGGQQLRPAGPRGFLPRPHSLSLSLCSGAIRQNIGQCRCPGIGHEVRALTCNFSYVCLSVCQSVEQSFWGFLSFRMLCEATEQEQPLCFNWPLPSYNRTHTSHSPVSVCLPTHKRHSVPNIWQLWASNQEAGSEIENKFMKIHLTSQVFQTTTCVAKTCQSLQVKYGNLQESVFSNIVQYFLTGIPVIPPPITTRWWEAYKWNLTKSLPSPSPVSPCPFVHQPSSSHIQKLYRQKEPINLNLLSGARCKVSWQMWTTTLRLAVIYMLAHSNCWVGPSLNLH